LPDGVVLSFTAEVVAVVQLAVEVRAGAAGIWEFGLPGAETGIRGRLVLSDSVGSPQSAIAGGVEASKPSDFFFRSDEPIDIRITFGSIIFFSVSEEVNVFEGCELMSTACVTPGEAPWLVFTAEVERTPCPDVFCTAAL
jgi:hypothetical protein